MPRLPLAPRAVAVLRAGAPGRQPTRAISKRLPSCRPWRSSPRRGQASPRRQPRLEKRAPKPWPGQVASLASFDATGGGSIAAVGFAAGLDRLETCARFVALLEVGALAPSLVGRAGTSHATLISAARRPCRALLLQY